jgi:glycosyltransferase 2 family protein
MKATSTWRRLIGSRWQFWFGMLLGVAALYLAARGLDFRLVGQVLASVRLPYVLAALLVYLFTQVVKAIRWRWLLSTRPVEFNLHQLSDLLVIGQAVNLLIPARLGDLVRAYLAGEEGNASKTYILGTIAAEKLIDLVALAVLILALLPFIALPTWLAARQGPVILAAVAMALAVAGLILGRSQLAGWASRALGRLPGRAGERWQARLVAGLDGLAALGQRSAALAVWWWTVVTWLLATLTNLLLFMAFNLPPAILPALFLLVVLQANVAVPSAPGRIGVFHYLCVLALGVFGVPSPVALGYGVVLHLIVVGGSSAWAALALTQRSWGLQQLAIWDT